MDGVTVIATYTVKDSGNVAPVIICGVLGMLALACVITLAWDAVDAYLSGGSLIVHIAAVALVLFLCCMFAAGFAESVAQLHDSEAHTEYTVTLDESVSYSEFTEKYEVLSEKGGVYRVREKEAENDDR